MEDKRKSETSRRDFIKNSSIVAAGFMILPRHVLGGKGFVAPSDRLLIAGIGVGGKGESDLTSFYKSGRADIGFLCDVDDRMAAKSIANFPKAKYYKDWREMFDKESKNFDAVSISTPDHNHAAPTLAAMQLGKHVYVQKPLTHDIYEARVLTEAAKRYKVVTQMGNQGASGDGVRKLMEWYNAGVIGKVDTVYCWTDRPVWPQGVAWPTAKADVPKELDWDLWLGTAPYKAYVERLVPFNWRGWWDYGTGALGDMGCHLIEPAFSVLGLGYPSKVAASVGNVYIGSFHKGYFPESCPPSSYTTITFQKTAKTKGSVKVHWMDGGIRPDRPEELKANEVMGEGGNGVLFIGSKGKMMCDTYGANPRLLPLSKNESVKVQSTIKRVQGSADGHYAQWVEACIAGYGVNKVSSPFEIAGPLTETLLIANLAIRAHDIRYLDQAGKNYIYPGRNIELLWDSKNLKVTNLDEVNQFVRRKYRDGWSLDL